ncbi:hypothetical protein ACQ3HE_12095 [Plantibacter auratus]|uniref:hypothetical protein n=1 Tax=Plantibacter auratus TaxID=272914 RepID=UPI003D32BE11
MPSPAGASGNTIGALPTGVATGLIRTVTGGSADRTFEVDVPETATRAADTSSHSHDALSSWDVVRSTFRPGEALTFDERYRYAQLPLIDADHPLALAASPDGVYRGGRYAEARLAVVIPVPVERLFVDPIFLSYEADLASAPFAPKLARGIELRRAHRLHATLSSIDADSGFLDALRTSVGAFTPFRVRLAGPVIGGFNRGRCYLPATADAFASIQRSVGGRPAPLVGVGLHHFRDELDAGETAALAAFLERWRDVTLFEWTVTELAITSTNDDLVLSGRTLARIPLHAAE